MNSCCSTVPDTKLNSADVSLARPASWPFAGLQRVIDAAGFTAVDLTHVVFVDPDAAAEATPRQTYSETR